MAKLACVASVSSRGSSRKLGQEQKKKINDGGGGGERPFFCFRSNFRVITRLETLATQAMAKFKVVLYAICILFFGCKETTKNQRRFVPDFFPPRSINHSLCDYV